MEVFGKELNFNTEINTELSDKQIKVLIICLLVLVIIGGSVPAILLPYLSIKKKNTEIEKLNQNLNVVKTTYLKEKKKYDKQYSIYQEQKADLDLLKIKFENSSLEDGTSLKFMVEDLSRYLGIKVKAIGRVEIAEEKKGYVKKYTPYTIVGKISDISKLFYYLENSNFLLTLRGAGVVFNQNGKDKKGNTLVETKLKIGAYFIEEGGEIGFE